MRSRNSEQGHPKARLKGYIYIIETGVDPALYSDLADPTFGRPPTLRPRVPTVSVPRRLDIHRKRQGSRISTIRSRRAPGKRKGPRLGSLCAPAAKKVSAGQGRQGERRYHCPGRRHARSLGLALVEGFGKRAGIFIIGSHAITLATPKGGRVRSTGNILHPVASSTQANRRTCDRRDEPNVEARRTASAEHAKMARRS